MYTLEEIQMHEEYIAMRKSKGLDTALADAELLTMKANMNEHEQEMEDLRLRFKKRIEKAAMGLEFHEAMTFIRASRKEATNAGILKERGRFNGDRFFRRVGVNREAIGILR